MKKKWIKGIAVTAILTMSMGMLAGCGGDTAKQGGNQTVDEGKTYKVGIVQLRQHGALDEANRGMIDGLKDNGFEEGENLKINQKNAQGDMSNLQTIAQQFIADKDDIILAIATPAAQVMASTTDEIPIVGTAITSFETAELVESDEAPGTNVTGTHDMSPVEKQIDLLLQVVPEAKKVGTIYTSSEINSEVQIGILKEIAEKKGLTVVEKTISGTNDVQQAAQSLVGEVDAIWLPTDNNVASAMPQIVGVTDEAGIVTVCGEESMVKAGGTLTYGINFYKIGYDAGVMAAQILQGKNVPAEMPIQGPKEEDLALVINENAVNILGITIPDDLKADATMVTTEVQ